MSPQRILIVDDEEDYLDTLMQGLVPYKETFLVHTAKDGKQALDVLDSLPVDMVVTDLKMPGLDGFQLMAHLRVNHPAIPVTVVSAFASDEVKKRLRLNGIKSVLDKPIALDALVAAILQGLAAQNPSGDVSGISMAGFLQLIEMEKKSCSVMAANQDGELGRFFFRKGDLLNARFGDLQGEEAAYRMLAWDSPSLSFSELGEDEGEILIKAPLMSLLLEASRRRDEALEYTATDMADKPLTGEPSGPERVNGPGPGGAPGKTPNSDHERRPSMAGLKPILKEMADEMDGVIALAVVGMDGILVAAHNPTGAEVEVLSAKFAMLLKLASRTTEQIKGMGEFEENLVQSQNTWVLARYLSQNYYLTVAVSRDSTLGNIRLVATKYADKLARAL